MRALILAAALCGCQRYADLAGPVEDAVQEVGQACYFPIEHSSGYEPADSSAACWDGSRPHMVAIAWQRAPRRECLESVDMGRRAQRWYGCSRAPADTIPL